MPTIPGPRRPREPFDAFPAWITASPKIGAGEMAVLLVLIHHRNGRTRRCTPSHQTIALETGLSPATVKRVLTGLRDKGLVGWVQRDGQPNNYRLTLTQGVDHSDLGGRSQGATEPEEGNQMNEPPAGAAEPAGDGALFAAEEFQREQVPVANDLTKAWCWEWAHARGKQPPGALAARVGKSAKEVAAGCSTEQDWSEALLAAKEAGRRGTFNILNVMADFTPQQRTNPFMDIVRDAHAAERLYGSPDLPEIGTHDE